ncbi:M48 family metallopeptidase [Arhodomonas aquaeolei]|uniref:M48 family metallopeptidase n=1 Tax=Arhodomonas TaxID=2368 RepID=UPI0013CF5170|nr:MULTISPECIES: SprT family zinc-dependent metalloprotease [Arhodomonas]MCS4505516.1 M48 family metallopeptidase [Arhodomonas aquaeolei]
MLPRTLTVGETVIPLRRRVQRRRTIALHLLPGPVLELRLPRGCPEAVVRRFLDSRRSWVERALPGLPVPRRLEEGAPHPVLGVEYPLRLERAGRYGGEVRDGTLRLTLPGLDEGRVAEALRRFYRTRAERVFAERLSHWCDRLAHWPIGQPGLRLRRMRRRWGSCSRSGEVTLNVRLVERDEALIDLVVVHELCHLLEFNHSRRFYALMDEALPDWRARSEALDSGALGPDV